MEQQYDYRIKVQVTPAPKPEDNAVVAATLQAGDKLLAESRHEVPADTKGMNAFLGLGLEMALRLILLDLGRGLAGADDSLIMGLLNSIHFT